jgi:hypothetical protein
MPGFPYDQFDDDDEEPIDDDEYEQDFCVCGSILDNEGFCPRCDE